MSKEIATVDTWFLRFDVISLWSFRSACCVEWPDLNPNWYAEIGLTGNSFSIFSFRTDSNNFPMLDNSDIGRKLLKVLSLIIFFFMGIIFANFQSDGKYPLLMQLLKRHVSRFITLSGNFLMRKLEISSGPLDFLQLILVIAIFIFSGLVK